MNKNAKNNSTVTPETSKDFEAKRIEDLAPTVAANLNKLLKTQNISAKELSEKTISLLHGDLKPTLSALLSFMTH